MELSRMGFEVLLVGRLKEDSMPLEERPYDCHRMKLIFERGPLFYAEYNIRLFLLLLSSKVDILHANDLDTLLANHLASRLRNKPLIYDSHEYFTETPEVIHRPFVRKVWLRIEKWIFPKVHAAFTVNTSLADIFENKYKIPVRVMRNVPRKRKYEVRKTRQELQLPDDRKIILLQGAGINIQRGAEEAVMAMQHLDGVLLLIIGGGDVMPILHEMVDDLKLNDKVRILPKQPYEILYDYTVLSDLGLTLDKDTNPNYRYSLPNKLFDYIQARVPVLASPMTEIKKIVDEYGIGDTIENHEPQHIASKIQEAAENSRKMEEWKENLIFASAKLCWENEKHVLEEVYKAYA